MARRKLPWFRFYPGDYLNDQAIRMLNHEERGVWMDLICIAAHSPLPGALLLDNGIQISKQYVIQAVITPALIQKTSERAEKVLKTLLSLGLVREGVEGTLYNRRLLFWRTEWEEKTTRGKAGLEEWLTPRRLIVGPENVPKEFMAGFKTRPAKRTAGGHPPQTEVSEIAGQLTNLLIGEMLRNLPTSKVPAEGNGAFTNWAREVDRMIELDGRDPKEIEKIILFSQRDGFWHKNIRSTAKLRKQFEPLQLKMRSDGQTWKQKPKETEDERISRAIREGIK